MKKIFVYIFFSTTWDTVEFHVKVLSNSKFDFEEHFDSCINASKIGNFSIEYMSNSKQEGGFDKSVVSAKFKHGGNEYFIIIESFGKVEPTEKIAQYLDMLFSE